MFAGDVGRAFDGGLHIAQSAVRSRTKERSITAKRVMFLITTVFFERVL
jgi:hypothetical protein